MDYEDLIVVNWQSVDKFSLSSVQALMLRDYGVEPLCQRARHD